MQSLQTSKRYDTLLQILLRATFRNGVQRLPCDILTAASNALLLGYYAPSDVRPFQTRRQQTDLPI